MLLEGLELVRKADVKSLAVYSDPNLLIQQMNREYNIRDATLKQYVNTTKDYSQAFEQLSIEKVRRALNAEGGSLSKADQYHEEEHYHNYKRVKFYTYQPVGDYRIGNTWQKKYYLKIRKK